MHFVNHIFHKTVCIALISFIFNCIYYSRYVSKCLLLCDTADEGCPLKIFRLTDSLINSNNEDYKWSVLHESFILKKKKTNKNKKYINVCVFNKVAIFFYCVLENLDMCMIIFMPCYYNIKLKYLPSATKYPDPENILIHLETSPSKTDEITLTRNSINTLTLRSKYRTYTTKSREHLDSESLKLLQNKHHMLDEYNHHENRLSMLIMEKIDNIIHFTVRENKLLKILIRNTPTINIEIVNKAVLFEKKTNTDRNSSFKYPRSEKPIAISEAYNGISQVKQMLYQYVNCPINNSSWKETRLKEFSFKSVKRNNKIIINKINTKCLIINGKKDNSPCYCMKFKISNYKPP